MALAIASRVTQRTIVRTALSARAIDLVRSYHGDQDKPKHRSNAEQLIKETPPIEVEGKLAICDGGGGENGHPAEWIQVDTREGRLPAACKYCGLRFIKKAGNPEAAADLKAKLVANTFP